MEGWAQSALSSGSDACTLLPALRRAQQTCTRLLDALSVLEVAIDDVTRKWHTAVEALRRNPTPFLRATSIVMQAVEETLALVDDFSAAEGEPFDRIRDAIALIVAAHADTTRSSSMVDTVTALLSVITIACSQMMEADAEEPTISRLDAYVRRDAPTAPLGLSVPRISLTSSPRPL